VRPRAGLNDAEKRPGLELVSFSHPARSQSLYRLRYPGSSRLSKYFFFFKSKKYPRGVHGLLPSRPG
jgi:hypothetical protein